MSTDSRDPKGAPPASVIHLPLSRARATAMVQEIAKDSRRWSINLPLGPGPDWRQLVNRRNVDQVLRGGTVLEEFVQSDEGGYWRFSMVRMCGGLQVTIEVALEQEPAIPRLLIVGIKGEQVSLSEYDHE